MITEEHVHAYEDPQFGYWADVQDLFTVDMAFCLGWPPTTETTLGNGQQLVLKSREWDGAEDNEYFVYQQEGGITLRVYKEKG